MKKSVFIILILLLSTVSFATVTNWGGNTFTGLSSDTKPTNVPNGSRFFTTDPPYSVYIRTGGVWEAISSASTSTVPADKTCSGTDKVSAYDATTGDFTCTSDSTVGSAAVTSFNTRTGDITPASGDYAAFYSALSHTQEFSTITGSVAPSQLPLPTGSTIGGVKSLTCGGTDKLSAIGTDGLPICSLDTGATTTTLPWNAITAIPGTATTTTWGFMSAESINRLNSLDNLIATTPTITISIATLSELKSALASNGGLYSIDADITLDSDITMNNRAISLTGNGTINGSDLYHFYLQNFNYIENISLYQVKTIVPSNGRVRNSAIKNVTFTLRGIYFINSGETVADMEGFTISNCNYYAMGYRGDDFYSGNSSVVSGWVEGIIINDNDWYSDMGTTGAFVSISGRNNQIINNRIHGNDTLFTGISFFPSHSHPRKAIENNIIQGNKIYNVAEEAITFDGLGSSPYSCNSLIRGVISSITGSSISITVSKETDTNITDYSGYYMWWVNGNMEGEIRKIISWNNSTRTAIIGGDVSLAAGADAVGITLPFLHNTISDNKIVNNGKAPISFWLNNFNNIIKNNIITNAKSSGIAIEGGQVDCGTGSGYLNAGNSHNSIENNIVDGYMKTYTAASLAGLYVNSWSWAGFNNPLPYSVQNTVAGNTVSAGTSTRGLGVNYDYCKNCRTEKNVFDAIPSTYLAGDGVTVITNNHSTILQSSPFFNYGRLGIGASPGVNIELAISKTASATGDYVINKVSSLVTSTTGNKYFIGLDSQPTVTGTNALSLVAGVYLRPNYNINATMPNYYGFLGAPNILTGLITNLYHNSFWDYTGSGTVTNQYGVYIAPLSKATTNYAIYTDGATPSYFGGKVGINTLVPVSHLTVSGLLSTTPSGTWGNITPDYDFTILSTNSNAGFKGYRISEDTGASGYFTLKARGTVGAATEPLADDALMSLSAGGYANSTWNLSKALIQLKSGGTWTTSSMPTYITFGTTTPNSTTRAERMRINSDGFVGIGTTAPASKLDVAGIISTNGYSMPTYSVLLSDVTDSVTGASLATFMTWTPPASKTITMSGVFTSVSASTQNAIQYKINNPTGPSTGNCKYTQPATVSADIVTNQQLSAVNNTSNTVCMQDCTYPQTTLVWCSFTTPASPGAIYFQFTGESGWSGGTGGVKAGSYINWIASP